MLTSLLTQREKKKILIRIISGKFEQVKMIWASSRSCGDVNFVVAGAKLSPQPLILVDLKFEAIKEKIPSIVQHKDLTAEASRVAYPVR